MTSPSVESSRNPESAQSLSNPLTWRYSISLLLLAVLAIAGQVFIQGILRQQESDARMINLAGRQRMLSQRLAKAAMQAPSSEQRTELANALQDITRVHLGLQYGDEKLGLPGELSPRVRGYFRSLSTHFDSITAAANVLIHDPIDAKTRAEALSIIQRHESPFLETMEAIVFRLDTEAQNRVAGTKRLEATLMLLTLVVLLLEALLVFRPAVGRLSSSVSALIRARDALARTEADQQATLQAIPDGLARLTGDGRLSVLKTSGRGLFGRELDQGAAVAIDEFAPTVSAALTACRTEVRKTNRVATRQLVVSKNATESAFEVRIAPSRGAGHLVIVRDVSARRRLEAEVLDAYESAQSNVGRELHDGLCQHLAGLALLARARTDNPKTDEFVKLLDDGVAQARELALGLYPATLTNLGLSGALEELTHHVERVSELRCTAALPDHAIDLSDDAALQLYRIAQEAAANAVKHSGASRLDLRFSVTAGWLTLEIEDNGCGLPPEQQRRSGLGLDTMAYRARLLNGDFAVVIPDSGGTTVRCRIPIGAAAFSAPDSPAPREEL